MTEALKPCPFCGSPGDAHTHPEIDTMHIAGCSNSDCIAHQVAYDFVSRETAVAAWNTRAEPPGYVRESVYLSAVKGRADFRRALREARATSSSGRAS